MFITRVVMSSTIESLEKKLNLKLSKSLESSSPQFMVLLEKLSTVLDVSGRTKVITLIVCEVNLLRELPWAWGVAMGCWVNDMTISV